MVWNKLNHKILAYAAVLDPDWLSYPHIPVANLTMSQGTPAADSDKSPMHTESNSERRDLWSCYTLRSPIQDLGYLIVMGSLLLFLERIPPRTSSGKRRRLEINHANRRVYFFKGIG